MRGEEATQLRRRVERLERLAALARPVQHELNNLLTVVFANLDLVRRVAPDGAPRRQLDRIEEASRRLQESLGAMLGVTRRALAEEAAVPPAEALQALVPLLRLMLPAPGALEVRLGAGPWPARFPRAQIEGLLLDLAAELGTRGVASPPLLSLSVANAPGALGGRDGIALGIGLPPGLAGAEEVSPLLARLSDLSVQSGGVARPSAEGVVLTLPRQAEDG